MRYFLFLLSALALLFGSIAPAAVTPVWSTGVAVPGEKVVLYLIDTEVNEDVFFLKGRPTVQRARLEALSPQVGPDPFHPDAPPAEILPIVVVPDAPGNLTVEGIELEYRSGRKEKVTVPPLPVVSTGEIRWQDSPITFGALWYTANKEPYVDQPVRAAVKLFLPGDCEAPLAPTISSVNVRAGTFRPALMGLPAILQSHVFPAAPTAFAKGQTWRTAEYDGILTPFREGNADISGKIVIAQRQGFFGSARADATLPVLRLGALPLPPAAPADYAHAVGTFTLSAKTSATELAMNEVAEVEITVQGTGNTEQLECPEPEDAAGWKLVPATRKPLLNANGETVGMVFSRLMRPTAEVRGIPSFAFSYFDPQSMDYKQVRTAPIALPWRKSDTAGDSTAAVAAEPPPAGTIPVAEMSDIYGYLPAELYGRPFTLPRPLLYLLYLPAAAVLLCTLWGILRRRYAAGAAERAREKELDRLAHETDALAFLRGIGSCIESRVPTERLTPELQAILDRRDDEAFRPDAGTSLSPEEKSAMLRALRKALSTAALLLLCLLPAAQAAETTDEAEQAYKAGQYSHALQWLEQTPVPEGQEARVLYNKGNCAYRLGKTGEAALLYTRALRLDPGLAEARANLDFLRRKEGAVLPELLPEDEVFTYLTPDQLRVLGIILTALLALLLALLFARRAQATPRLNLAAGFTLVLCLLCGFNAVYYATREAPTPASVAAETDAVVTAATQLRCSADTQGGLIMELTVSTPLQLLAKRGDWCYVRAYANGTRGWVPTADLGFVADSPAPAAPVLLRL